MLGASASESDRKFIDREVQRSVEGMAQALISIRFADTRKRRVLVSSNDSVDLTPEQSKQITKAIAHQQLHEIALTAFEQGGELSKVRAVLSAAQNFYSASGMAYRQLEIIQYSTVSQHKRDAPLIRNEQALDSLNLWLPCAVSGNEGNLGRNSMLCADRDMLREAAAEYYQTGLRCSWFEKMLLEALVAAESWATIQEVKRNPVLSLGKFGLTRSFLWSWVYETTGGKSPQHELLIGVVNLALGLLAAIALGCLAWISAEKLETDEALWGYVGLLFCGWILLNWIGKFVVQMVLRWATPPTAASARGLQKTLWELDTVCRLVAVPAMSLHIVRDALLRCAENNAVLDQITQGLVERGIRDGDVRRQLS